MSRHAALAVSLALASCAQPVPAEDAAPSEDAGGVEDARPATDAARQDAGPPPPPWPADLPPITTTSRRDMHLARAIVHIHSPLSHDACDGEGWVDGALADPGCLEHMREGACRLHMDSLFITDHSPHVNEVRFEDAFWATRASDALVRDAEGRAVAGTWGCPDGHRVLVLAGSENEMMPVGLTRHPSEDPGVLADPEQLSALYDADGAEGAARFREAGALVLYAHTEGHSLEQLRASRPDGFEIYNTHANIDPNIREEHLGLGRLDFAPLLLRFTDADNAMEPDLALLSFLTPNDNALAKLDTLLAEGARVFGTAGCDAHENSFPMPMPDGERGDSYRRMMYWHTHHLLVRGEGRAALMEALGRGRLYVTFEVFGSPIGFDYTAEAEGGAICEMGDDCPVGATLRVAIPSLPPDMPRSPAPTLRIRVLRAAVGGAVEVASREGVIPGETGSLEFVATEPGAYRVEVWMTPSHARPYLGTSADALLREVPWIYANPIFVVAP